MQEEAWFGVTGTRCRGLGDFYIQQFERVKLHGRDVTVRGQRCREAKAPVVFEYTCPGYCWMHIPGRRFNPFFALAEVVWILSGRNDVKWLSYFNSNVAQFSDDGVTFHGAYGDRLRKWPLYGGTAANVTDQFQQVVNKLEADPYTRQAVMSLWDPDRDNELGHRDYPCNNIVYLSLRDGKLDMTVVIRSNDLIWGAPYNAVQFSHIHAYIAGWLNCRIGTLTYFIQNLHFYYDLYPEALVSVENASIVAPVAGCGRVAALSHPGFETVTPGVFDSTRENVEAVLSTKAVRPWSWYFDSFGCKHPVNYWTFTIPLMIWIYRSIKECACKTPAQIENLATHIRGVGEPFTTLIMDWLPPSNPLTPELKVIMEREQSRHG